MPRTFNTHLMNLLRQWFEAHARDNMSKRERLKDLILEDMTSDLENPASDREAENRFQNLIAWFTV